MTFLLPRQLRGLAGESASIGLPTRPATLGEALAALRAECPAVYHRIVTEQGELRPHLNLFVDREHIRHTGGLATVLGEDAEILVLRAVSGG